MCNRPLRFWRSDILDENGNYPGFITGYDVKQVDARDFERKGIPSSHSFVTKEFVEVPCGRCFECQLARKRQWTFRSIAESRMHKFNYFLTITYDDDHVKMTNKPEMQKFVKYLRRLGFDFKYYLVGELGNQSKRPHYHMAMFSDTPIIDGKIWSSGKNPLYRSATLEKAWLNKGQILYGRLDAASIRYTLGYINAKEKDQTFALMSKNLGRSTFEEKLDQDVYYFGTGDGNFIKGTLPRYLKKKYGLASPYDPMIQKAAEANLVYVYGEDLEDIRDKKESLAQQELHYKV